MVDARRARLARGFIGTAFRIDDKNRFESIYLRPANSRVDDQIRRNHTIQCVAYPDFPFPLLRRDAPEKYETHDDIGVGEWIGTRIEAKGTTARLFLNDGPNAAFIASDLKLGADQCGGIGLWIEAGTVGYFADLQVVPPH